MNNAVDVWVFLEDIIQSRFVCDVHFVERRSLAGDELNTVDDFFRGIVEVVDDDNVVARLEKSNDSEGTNVTAATEAHRSAMPGELSGALGRRKGAFKRMTYPVTSAEPTAIFEMM